jgi:hypothetical protein
MSNDGVKGQWKCPTQIFQPDSNRRILRPARWMCVRVVSTGAFSLDLEIAPRKIWRNTEIQDGAPKIAFSWDVVAKKLWFMVDITNQLMGFINQLITGGVHVPWNTISVVSNFCIQEKSADCESWSYYGYSKHISMGYPDWKCSWIFSIGRQWRWDGIWWNHCEDYAEKPPVEIFQPRMITRG